MGLVTNVNWIKSQFQTWTESSERLSPVHTWRSPSHFHQNPNNFFVNRFIINPMFLINDLGNGSDFSADNTWRIIPIFCGFVFWYHTVIKMQTTIRGLPKNLYFNAVHILQNRKNIISQNSQNVALPMNTRAKHFKKLPISSFEIAILMYNTKHKLFHNTCQNCRVKKKPLRQYIIPKCLIHRRPVWNWIPQHNLKICNL